MPKTHDPLTQWVSGARHDVGTEDTKMTPGSHLQEGLSAEATELEVQFEACWARQATSMPGMLAGKWPLLLSRGWGLEGRWDLDWAFISERHFNRPWMGQEQPSRENSSRKVQAEKPGRGLGLRPQEPWVGSEGCSYCLDNRTCLFLPQCLCSECLRFSPSHYQHKPLPQNHSSLLFLNSTLLLWVSVMPTFSSLLSPLNIPTVLVHTLQLLFIDFSIQFNYITDFYLSLKLHKAIFFVLL